MRVRVLGQVGRQPQDNSFILVISRGDHVCPVEQTEMRQPFWLKPFLFKATLLMWVDLFVLDLVVFFVTSFDGKESQMARGYHPGRRV